jgi:CBS-domain-containing membrane protein
MRAKDIMSSPVHTVSQNASVESATELMTAKSVMALPVVDATGALVGMQHRLDEYADGQRRWTGTVDGGIATVAGEFHNDTEEAVVAVLARTVPGAAAVKVRATKGS